MANIAPLPDPSIERKRILRWLWCILALGAVIVLTPILGFSIWRWNLQRELETRVAAVRAKGLPVDLRDLAKWPSLVKDSENAAWIYTNAIGHLETSSDGGDEPDLPKRGEPPSDETSMEFSDEVQENRGALDIAYSAEKFHESRYSVDYQDGAEMVLPHLAGLKQIAYLLELEALLKAEAGDSNGAAKAIGATIHVSESLDNEPILISQRSSAAILDWSCHSLERTLCRIALSDQALAKLYRQLVSAEKTNRLLTGAIGDRALDSEAIRLILDGVTATGINNGGAPKEGQIELSARRSVRSVWGYLGSFERERNFFLGAVEKDPQIISMPPPASLSHSNEMEKLNQEASSGHYLVSRAAVPVFSRIPGWDAAIRSTLRVTITAIAVERWRIAHQGAIPDSLDALVPSFLPVVPGDPYDGQPVKFKRTAKGYVVYSIGPDGQDDGGKERPMLLSPGDRYDVTFTVER